MPSYENLQKIYAHIYEEVKYSGFVNFFVQEFTPPTHTSKIYYKHMSVVAKELEYPDFRITDLLPVVRASGDHLHNEDLRYSDRYMKMCLALTIEHPDNDYYVR